MNIDEWRFSFEIAWDDQWFRWQSIGTAVVFILAVTLLFFRLIPAGLENDLLVFHYNQYLGIDVVQHWFWMFIYFGAFVLILITDFIASFRLYRHDRVASRLLLCTGTFFVILMTIISQIITSINT